MNGALIALPSANITNEGIATWAVGSADPLYPVANVQTLEPDVVAKTSAAGAATLRVTLDSPSTLQGVALINTNLGGHTVTLTNNGGLPAQARVVPAPLDGLNESVWWDLRAVPHAPATQWNLAWTDLLVPAAVGSVLLIYEWVHLRVRWGWEWAAVYPRIEQTTGYGKRIQYWIPVRTRRYKADAFDAAQRDVLRALKQEAHGSIGPWLLVPDVTDTPVVLVQFVPDVLTETYRFASGTFPAGTAKGEIVMPIEVEEVNNGVAL